MFSIRSIASLALALVGFAAISFGANDVSVMNDSDAQQVRAGQAAFTRQCFQNVSDCIVCTSNNTSCTQSGRIDACRLTPPSTLCAVLINPPKCGLLISWSMPSCGGIGAISFTQCSTFICA